MARNWYYKNNAERGPGDWSIFFAGDEVREWGGTDRWPALAQLEVGDRVFCQQSDRREFVGTARVAGWKLHREYAGVLLKPEERINVKIPLLKEAHPLIRGMRALQPGPEKSLWELYPSEADRLLATARALRKNIRLIRIAV